MKRLFILVTLLMCLSLTGICQDNMRVLSYEQLDYGTELFSNKEDWSEIIIQYTGNYDLDFKINGIKILDHTSTPINIENLDKSSYKSKAILANKKINSDEIEYTLWIRVPERQVTPELIISSSNTDFVNKVIINLSEIKPKRRTRYRLYDPYDSSGGSVFQYHQVMGNELFNDCNYAAARQEYVLASYCEAPDYDKENVQVMIANCDSMIVLINRVNQYVINEQWMDVIRCTRQAGQYNPSDTYLINTYKYCNKKLLNDSNTLLAEAQDLFDQGQYAEAKAIYEKVAGFHGPFSAIAEGKSRLCDETAQMELNRERYLGLEYGIGGLSTVGLTKGKYTNSLSNYFTFRINVDIFNLLRQRYYINERARLDITPIGFTFPVYRKDENIFKGAWLNIGLGATAINIYKPKEGFMEWATDKGYASDASDFTQQMVDKYLNDVNSKKSSDALEMNIKFAATPEIGAVIKVWKVGVRLTYRHYIAINKEITHYIGNSQFAIGIGYCY